uniref:Mating type protein MAT-2 n=2 Tax=Cochliobolus lunatus TaxID=5503 RepID=A0A140F3N6_COCLU|nr:mating type protein MAT-2 [Curvularia lunata]
MDTAVVPNAASFNSLSLAEALKIAEARFEAAVQGCKDDWTNGHDMVILQDNIPQLFGGILVDHFKRCVGQVCGFPVHLTVMDGGHNNYHTLVQMPKNIMHSAQVSDSPPSAQTSPSEHKSGPNASGAGLKKAPRPMNCWIIFRDAMHKHLKTEFPDLTVQEISTRCSAIWHNLSDEAKQPWKDAAQSAKEEHSRIHPDYKYSPRKPGEKKKRQSRKASKRAAAMAEQVLQFQILPDLFASTPEGSDQSLIATNTVAADESNTIHGDVLEFADVAGTQDFYSQDPMAMNPFYDAEAIRQGLLEAEFGAMFNLDMPFTEIDDGLLSFHDGATEDAALPAVLQDLY